jgi:hypothetical protein
MGYKETVYLSIILLRVKWLDTGFGLVIGFIELSHLVTTSNYSCLIDSHSLQFTMARTKSSTSSLGVATQRDPMMGTATAPTTPPGDDCLTTTSDSDWSVCPQNSFDAPIGSPYIACARTQQRTPPPTVPLSLRAECCCDHVMVTDRCVTTNARLIAPSHVYCAVT